MISEISSLLSFLLVLAALSFLVALFFAIKLYRETDRGWYWLTLVLSALFFGIAHWTLILFPFSFVGFEFLALIQESSEIIASLLFALSCYGMYSTMKRIRKRIE